MLDGAAKVTPMLAEAKRLEMPAIGMTDHGNMFGASEFYNACLLYTSDAADERSSVDLGGRRIIKKKKKTTTGGHTTSNQKK